MKLSILLLTLFSAACGGGTAAVQCDKDLTCDLSTAGRCAQSGTGNHWCAYPDGACPSGLRYSTFQVGEGLAGVCVAAAIDAGTGTDAPPGMACRQVVVFSDAVYRQNPEIWIANLDGTNPINLSQSPAYDSGPVWAPTGDRVAFFSDRGSSSPQGHFDIYAVNTDGTGLVNLTAGSTGSSTSPRWSPDGTRIAFIREREPWVMNADGSGATRIWAHQVASLEWSPAGNKLLANDFTGVLIGALYVLGVADGTEPRKLTSLTGSEISPSWTARIYFEHLSDIYAVNGDGTGLENLTQDGLRNGNPRASSNGSVVAFDSRRGNPNGEVWVRKEDTSKRLTQVTLPSGESYLVTDISADGQYVAALHETTMVKNPDGEGSRVSIVRLADGSVSDFNAPSSEQGNLAMFAPCRQAGTKLASVLGGQ